MNAAAPLQLWYACDNDFSHRVTREHVVKAYMEKGLAADVLSKMLEAHSSGGAGS